MTDDHAHTDRRRPRVAILSPFHNRAASVERTFRSIANQTYPDWQALFWDDCSTDDTWQQMQRVAADIGDDRITIHHYPSNVGLTTGLNNAIRSTDADYIAIVGSGDECHPDRIARQVAALDNDPAAAFCATASVTIDPLTHTVFSDESFDKGRIEYGDITEQCPFTHGSVMYRAAALAETDLYETAFVWCADWDMFFRLLTDSHAVYLPDVLYTRYADPDGVSFSPKKAFDQITFKHLALTLSTKNRTEREQVIAAVRRDGVHAALSDSSDAIARDLARRNIKLYLMKRGDAGQTMETLASDSGTRYPPKYRFYLEFARRLSRSPISTDRAITLARKLPR